MCSPSRTCAGGWLFSVGLLCALLGVWLSPPLDGIVLDTIDAEFVVSSNKSKGYSSFVFSGDDPEAEVLVNISLFEVSNPKEVLAGSAPTMHGRKGTISLQAAPSQVQHLILRRREHRTLFAEAVRSPRVARSRCEQRDCAHSQRDFSDCAGTVSDARPGAPRSHNGRALSSNVSNTTQQEDYLFDEYTGAQLLFGFNVTLSALGEKLSLRYPGMFGNASIADVLSGKHYVTQWTALLPATGETRQACALAICSHTTTRRRYRPTPSSSLIAPIVVRKRELQPLSSPSGARPKQIASWLKQRPLLRPPEKSTQVELFDFFWTAKRSSGARYGR